MKQYRPKDIEPKWQKIWEDTGIYRARDDSDKPKKYILEFFPYPSGVAMHVGHVRNYAIGDAIARYYRMQGFEVLHPMGWDAFGLPAENYAIKNKVSPQKAVEANVERFKQQLGQMGFGFDWDREINSTDPAYYKWTQWFFLYLYEKGLAYRKESLQWWCPVDKTVLANEQVEDGRCWRCDSVVEKKALPQWFFKITDYADRLAKDLDDVDWSNAIKSMQRNWIGRSTGAEIEFAIDGSDEKVSVFTTRHDTQFGVTFMVLAPEHPLVNIVTVNEHKDKVAAYVKQAQAKSDIERQEAGNDKEKTGVFTGSYAINPINGEKIPVWVADYVLMGYGTGAVMGVPGHDERDKVFAEKFELEIRKVYEVDDGEDYHAEGTIINSDKYDGLSTQEARKAILADMIKAGYAQERVNYKIRDWLISRQRYWGAPIPMIHCEQCGVVPVPEDQLPVELPELKEFEPSGDGRSPLANIDEFLNTICPKCEGPAQRETDTMDGFACSSWYFLRYADPHNSDKPFDADKVAQWLPVDDYIGGAEHAVMHLLYARFWTKVMQDGGLIDFGEPFQKLRNQGMILAPDGNKMSKSKGNTIEPDGLIEQGYGADSIRIMELFIGPWNQSANWSVEGMAGSYRFLQRVWTLVQEYLEAQGQPDDAADNESVHATELMQVLHRTIDKVTKDMDNLGFNTAIAAQMEAVNALYKIKNDLPFDDAPQHWRIALEGLLQLLAPFAPHMSEELWQQLGHEESVHVDGWPIADEQYLQQDLVTIVVQVNGKVRANLVMEPDASEEQMVEAAKADEKAAKFLDKEIVKTITVPGKLVNFVVRP